MGRGVTARPLLSSFAAGTLFGAGLTVSQMVNPEKVVGFLDFAGAWDPSLALVMASALAVTAVLYRWTLRRRAPLCAVEFHVPTSRRIDGRLIGGSALFGIGWGLAGFCPGPAIASSTFGLAEPALFVAAMIAGMAIWEWRDALQPKRNEPRTISVRGSSVEWQSRY